MMKTTYCTKIISLLLVIGLCISCHKTYDEPSENWDVDLNLYFNNLPNISEEMPDETAETVVEGPIQEEDSDYNYSITKYHAAEGFDEQIVLNPTTDVIYPGALVQGESILDGTYTLIPAKRKPIKISTSLIGSESVSIEIQDPKLSSVRESINKLMNQEYECPPANMGFEIYDAYSEQQLDLSLHVSYKGKALKISGGFDYNSRKKNTRLVAKFIQSYYTIDMDQPLKPSDLFEEQIDKALIGTFAPMYISTITYGRLAFFTVESSLSKDSVKAYLNASYRKVSGGASIEFNRLLATSNIRVYILGGSGEDASKAIDGYEAFKNYIKQGGNYSKESPGAIISYTLRNIKDNSIAKIVYAADYSIVERFPKAFNYVFTIDALEIKDMNDFNDKNGIYTQYPNKEELIGNIKCNVSGTADEEELWHYYGGYWPIARDVYKNLDQDPIDFKDGHCTRKPAVFDNIFMNDSITFRYSFSDYNWNISNELIEEHEETISVSELINTADSGKDLLVNKEKIYISFKIAYEKTEN
ncbi:thiol-activated cytolysin family protein [Ancylomarina sp. YFZ004]